MRCYTVVVALWVGWMNASFGLKLPVNRNMFGARKPPMTIHSSSVEGFGPTPPSNTKKGYLKNVGTYCSYSTAMVLASALPAVNITLTEVAGRSFPRTPFTSVREWWRRTTDYHSGVLLSVLPSFIQKIRSAAEFAPVVTHRVRPYINPPASLWAMLTLLQSSRVQALSHSLIKASMTLGALCLLKDMRSLGSGGSDLVPRNDSYAVVTGACDGIGREMSRQLYDHGYNLVLIDDSQEALQQLQEQLRTEKALIITSPRSIQWKCVPKVREYAQRALSLFRHTLLIKVANAQPATNADTTKTTNDSVRNVQDSAKKPRLSWWPTGSVTKPVSLSSTESATLVNNVSDADPITIKRQFPVTKNARQSIHLMVTDYGNPSAPLTVLKELTKHNLDNKIEILVNAADQKAQSPFLSASLQSLHRLLHTNIHFTLTLTHLLAPLIIRRTTSFSAQLANTHSDKHSVHTFVRNTTITPATGGGRILFVDSLLSMGPAPGHSIFAASKAFMLSFAQSLRRELLPQGVLVTIATLGAVRCSPSTRQSHDTSAILRGDQDKVNYSDETCDVVVEYSTEKSSACKPLPCAIDAEEGAGGERTGNDDTVIVKAEDSMAISRRCNLADSGVPVSADAMATTKVPLVHYIPGCSLSAQQAGRAVFAALRTGQDAITPGIVNKLYRYGICRLLPAPVLATLTQIALTPLQTWPYPQYKSTPGPAHSSSNVGDLFSSLRSYMNNSNTSASISTHTCVAIGASLLAQHFNSPIVENQM